MAVLFDIDGVLRRPTDNSPIRAGFDLYHQIRGQAIVNFLCEDKEKGDHFLRTNKIIKYDNIKQSKDYHGDWIAMIKSCRVQTPINYVVTANLDLVVPLLEIGIATFMFCAPSYMDAKAMPDGRLGRQSWAEVTAEIERQQEALAQDNRL